MKKILKADNKRILNKRIEKIQGKYRVDDRYSKIKYKKRPKQFL